MQIELARLETEAVPRRLRHEPPVPETLAELRDCVLENLGSSWRRPFAPELVDQTVGRHEFVGMQEQVGEERPLLPTVERDRATVPPAPTQGRRHLRLCRQTFKPVGVVAGR